MVTRIYSPFDARQEARATLAYNEGDLRRVLTLAQREGKPLVIRLGASFTLTKTITIPVELSGMALEGSPGIELRSAASPAIRIRGSNVRLRGFTMRAMATALDAIEITDAASYITMDDLTFMAAEDAAGAGYFARAVFVTGGTSIFVDVNRCVFQAERGIVVDSTALLGVSTVGYSYSMGAVAAFTAATPFNDIGLIPHYVGNVGMAVRSTSSSSISTGGRITDNFGCDITLGANTGRVAVTGNSFCAISTTASSGENRLAGNSDITSKALHSSDVDADAARAGAVTLGTAGPTVTVGDAGYLRLTFGAGSSGNVVLADGLFGGHRLTLFCVSYAGTATLPDSTASNVKLSAAWTPTADDTLSLIWDATDGNWIETSRSAN